MTQSRLLWKALLVFALSGVTVAQGVRITNMAEVVRKQWVDVAIPITDALSLPEFCELAPHGFPAWRGEHVGLHSTMFHIYVDMGPGETLTGNLQPASIQPSAAPQWSLSDWVAQASVGLIPQPVVFVGGEERRCGPVSFQEVESNRARKVFHMRARMPGTPLVCDQWIYVYTHQDLVRFEMTLTNSDPRTSELSLLLDGAWLESRQFVDLDYRTAQGMYYPLFQDFDPGHPTYGGWVQVLTGARYMGRGEQIFLSGSILCQPGEGSPLLPLGYTAGGMTIPQSPMERYLALLAELNGPVKAVCTDWDGKWLAFGMVPELPAGATNGGWDDADASAISFAGREQSPRDLYVQRPRGLQRSAGSTGSQEDFAASKGGLGVTVGDPRFLHEVGYSTYELFARPFHHREIDGSPILTRNYPGLTTWSQLVHCVTTQHTLGLNCPLPWSWPSNDWSGMDDEHRSQNNTNMMLALTGSHALRAVFKDLVEIDLAHVPGHTGTPRAEGRLHMAWANMLMLLDDPFDRERLYAHTLTRLQNLMNTWPGGAFLGDPSRPIRAMHVGSDPTFREPNGNYVPAIIVWEHSIAAMGYYAAFRVTGDSRYFLMAREVSRMIVNHCVFQENGDWIAATAIRYLQGAQEGMALPQSSYYTGSPDVHVSLNFWRWIYPAVLICRDLHGQEDPVLAARCDQIIAWHGGPVNWAEAEWWAVLPR